MGAEKKITTTVWTSALHPLASEIKSAALAYVRDSFGGPPSAVREVLVSREKKTIDGEEGSEYTVDVFYTPRGKGEEAIDLDQHLEALETPVFNPRDLDEMA